MKLPVVNIERFSYRTDREMVATCRLETFYADGIYCVLVTERGDNPGMSVTNSHKALRAALEKWLDIPKSMSYRFYEQYDNHSYSPKREDLSEVCMVLPGPHWVFVPEEDWRKVYFDPRQPKPKVVKRKA